MGKYQPLQDHLSKLKQDRIPMTFDEIQRVVGSPLPPSKRYRAWWSNNASNSVMTKAWLKADYRTSQVDVETGKLVFVKQKTPQPAAAATEKRVHHPIIGCMKGMITIAPGVDLTEPADPDWGKVYDD